MFFGGIPFTQADQNENYFLLLLGQKVENISSKIPKTSLDVRVMFPRWIVEKSEANPPTTHLINFTQSYYDWLYNYSEYKLIPTNFNSAGIRQLMDIGETPVEFLKHFTYSYASGFPEWYIGATAGPDGTDTSQGIRNFIKNIRQGFYQRKSTEDAYRYFFSSLYKERVEVDRDGIKESTEFFYPKADILRLNGGKFDGWGVVQVGGVTGHYGGLVEDIYDGNRGEIGPPKWNMGGSYLNGRYVIQDSYWYQEYSYVLKGYVNDVDEETGLPIYFDILHELLHPAGMKGFWEKTESDYVPPDDWSGGFAFGESPKLENYFPYRMMDESTIQYCAGCSGSGYTFDGPTAMFNGVSEQLYGGSTGWTYGSAWDGIGSGGICIEGYSSTSSMAAWGGVENCAKGMGRTFGSPTFFYPYWARGICGDADHSNPFREIYIGEFIQLSPAEDSPNIGLTGCTGYTKC